jgi:hypothetical protein
MKEKWHKFFLVLLLFAQCAWGRQPDFDIVIVGSSPIPLLEALHQHYLGKRVLILEEAPVCGGAWRSIDICGLYPVDVGCHTLGQDRQMFHFLEEYVGCKMVSLDNPHVAFEPGRSPNGFYPLNGCYEIIQNLLKLISKTDIVLLVNHALESVAIDPYEPVATIKTREMEFTTSKIFVTPYSKIKIANQMTPVKSKENKPYYHLYMLVEDPNPPSFSFRNSIGAGVSRLMNLTYFVGLEGKGMQLIVIQTYGNTHMQSAENYLELLKKQNLIAQEARIFKEEIYIYEQAYYVPQDIPNEKLVFETLNTYHIQEMTKYIPKWKQTLPTFKEALRNR